MNLQKTISVLDDMVSAQIIESFALSGAVAAYNYIEAAMTEDLDLLVNIQMTGPSGLITLQPILTYLGSRGYTKFLKEGVIVEGWPIQFLPVASELDFEALSQAERLEKDLETGFSSHNARVLRPEHLVAIALKVGRYKDKIRIAQFLDEDAVDRIALCNVIERHNLQDKWKSFCSSAERDNFCDPLAR